MHSLNQGTTALLTQHPSATYLPLPSVATGFAGPNGRCCAAGSPGGPASPATAIALAAAMAASSGMPSTMKDSRWLTLEVCRQFQRKMCSRDENECKFAHPPPQVDVQNGRVICCYDSIKGKCQRRDPPCKYFHPPHHLREQLLQNGRNNLIMKSMQLQLLHQQLLVQGAMLPLSAASTSPASAAAAAAAAVASVSNPNAQCAAPSGSPVSSAAAPLTSAGKLLYPSAPPMNLANHGMANTYSLLGVGLGPYLNAMAASSLNPMAAALNAAKAAAAAAAAGPVSLASGSLPQLGLSGMISLPPTPAKRPALADAKSGLPMFQTDVPAVATVPMAATTAGLYALQTVSVPQSVSDPSQMAVDTTAAVMATTDQQTGGSIVKSAGQKADEESTQAAISFYPETYIEPPPYGYP
uniref:C3H1-type domain-containing protein n=1 Tax=Schistocephalus solidus TaxID=70667 RepID=A0A0X3NSW2_SCHSO